MKAKAKGAILLVALTLAGCQSTGDLSYPVLKHEAFESPPANIEFKAEIGQPIITRVDGFAWPAFKVTDEVPFSFEGTSYSLRPGLYRVDGVTPSYSQATLNGRVASSATDVSNSRVSLILRDGQCEIIPMMVQTAAINEVTNPIQENIKGLITGERAIFGAPAPTEVNSNIAGQVIDQAKCFADYDFNPNQPGSSKRELVYLGQSGETLRFKYREYYDNLVRAAFSNDLTYNIAEDNVIGFRGARIEIIDASNTELTYLIRRHMEE
jgi:hypothetical protein